MITQCKYCDAVVEYDESDYQIAYHYGLDAIYVECPCCSRLIVVGAAEFFERDLF